jgi:hypothetical protein
MVRDDNFKPVSDPQLVADILNTHFGAQDTRDYITPEAEAFKEAIARERLGGYVPVQHSAAVPEPIITPAHVAALARDPLRPVTRERYEKIRVWHDMGFNGVTIARQLGISHSTVSRAIQALNHQRGV